MVTPHIKLQTILRMRQRVLSHLFLSTQNIIPQASRQSKLMIRLHFHGQDSRTLGPSRQVCNVSPADYSTACARRAYQSTNPTTIDSPGSSLASVGKGEDRKHCAREICWTMLPGTRMSIRQVHSHTYTHDKAEGRERKGVVL